MVDISDSKIEISLLEKLIVNWAIVPDALYYVARSRVLPNRYLSFTFSGKVGDLWVSRINRYHKLLKIMDENYGEISTRMKDTCFKSPCDYTRLSLAYARYYLTSFK